MDSRRSTRLVAAVFAASMVVAGCGDDGDEPSIPQSGERDHHHRVDHDDRGADDHRGRRVDDDHGCELGLGRHDLDDQHDRGTSRLSRGRAVGG